MGLAGGSLIKMLSGLKDEKNNIEWDKWHVFWVDELDKDKVYLVYCAGGVRSARACKKMSEMGFKFTVVFVEEL